MLRQSNVFTDAEEPLHDTVKTQLPQQWTAKVTFVDAGGEWRQWYIYIYIYIYMSDMWATGVCVCVPVTCTHTGVPRQQVGTSAKQRNYIPAKTVEGLSLFCQALNQPALPQPKPALPVDVERHIHMVKLSLVTCISPCPMMNILDYGVSFISNNICLVRNDRHCIIELLFYGLLQGNLLVFITS